MSFEETIRQVLREEIALATSGISDRLAALERRAGGQTTEAYLSTRSAAKIADATPATIRDWVAAGHLKRYGGDDTNLRVKASELYAFLERRGAKVVETEAELRERVEAKVARLVR